MSMYHGRRSWYRRMYISGGSLVKRLRSHWLSARRRSRNCSVLGCSRRSYVTGGRVEEYLMNGWSDTG